MTNIELFVKKLSNVEGTIVHRNKNEKDITSPYGIYRYTQPKASIFNYIDQVANEIGITNPSTIWSSEDIDRVNKSLDSDKVFELAVDFYKTFTPLDLDSIDINIAYAYFNIYTNSPKCANSAMQSTCNKFGESLKVDGIIGKMSKLSIENVLNSDINTKEFLYLFLLACKDYYINITVSSPNNYIQYLKGWNNRVNALIKGMEG